MQVVSSQSSLVQWAYSLHGLVPSSFGTAAIAAITVGVLFEIT